MSLMFFIQIRSPVTCQVGIWRFTLFTCRGSDPSNSAEYKIDDDVYILFNPWCKGKSYFLTFINKIWFLSENLYYFICICMNFNF